MTLFELLNRAPAWCKYFAVDYDGCGVYFSAKPVKWLMPDGSYFFGVLSLFTKIEVEDPGFEELAGHVFTRHGADIKSFATRNVCASRYVDISAAPVQERKERKSAPIKTRTAAELSAEVVDLLRAGAQVPEVARKLGRAVSRVYVLARMGGYVFDGRSANCGRPRDKARYEEVLRLRREGRSAVEIAELLGIGRSTVYNYIQG